LEAYPEEAQGRLTFVRPDAAQTELERRVIWVHPGETVFDSLAGWLTDRFGLEALHGAMFMDPTTTEDWLFHLATIPVLVGAPGEVLDYRLVALKQTVSGAIESCAIEHLLLLRPLSNAAPGRFAAARMARVLSEEARRHLLEVEGQRAIQEHRTRLMADLPQRKHLVSVGFGQREVELLRRRKALKDAVEIGRAPAVTEFAIVREELATLKAAREAKLAALDAEPHGVTLGEVRFVAHALVVPSIDAAEKEQYDAQVEATAMRFAMAYEQSFGAKVRDVSKPALARLAGLGDAPGFDLLSDRVGLDTRCIEVKGRAFSGDVYLTDNEWAKAANLRGRYWLYIVLGCASAGPALLRIQDPFARLTGTQKGGFTLRLGDLRAVAEQD
jgi:hypothetical protein